MIELNPITSKSGNIVVRHVAMPDVTNVEKAEEVLMNFIFANNLNLRNLPIVVGCDIDLASTVLSICGNPTFSDITVNKEVIEYKISVNVIFKYILYSVFFESKNAKNHSVRKTCEAIFNNIILAKNVDIRIFGITDEELGFIKHCDALPKGTKKKLRLIRNFFKESK
ncbi:MAG: hypothetical protein DRJ64_01615 [Thermoprotei archaeon]|nr:MAG: hypothetical protein DRJ64_01615 [Thermoprotei archaeon]